MDLKNLIKTIKDKYPVRLEVYPVTGGLHLSRIEIDRNNQGKGIGSKVMNEIIKYADTNNLVIGLTPEKILNKSKTSLISFYKNFGFVNNTGNNKNFEFRDSMIRNPKNIVENKVKGGKGDSKTPKDISDKHGVSLESINKEIKIGIEVEYEHTTSKEIATEIVMDHLMEFPDYYSNKKYGLLSMEDKMNESLIKETEVINNNLKFLIKKKGAPVGSVEVNPNFDKYVFEIVSLDLFEEFDDIMTGKSIIISLWRYFKGYNMIVLSPNDTSIPFWEKLSAKRLNNLYWMILRGH